MIPDMIVPEAKPKGYAAANSDIQAPRLARGAYWSIKGTQMTLNKASPEQGSRPYRKHVDTQAQGERWKTKSAAEEKDGIMVINRCKEEGENKCSYSGNAVLILSRRQDN